MWKFLALLIFSTFISDLSQKNNVPEAMVPGLYVVKEDNKIILQVPSSGQSAVCGVTWSTSKISLLNKYIVKLAGNET